MKILKPLLLIFAICLISTGISAILPIPFPASVISLIILLILLLLHVVKSRSIKEVSNYLLHNMAFFFIPAVVGILSSLEEIKNSILPLLVICVVSTFVTFAVTAFTVAGIMKLMEKRGGKSDE